MIAVGVASSGFGKHEPAHPFDFAGSRLDSEVMRFGTFLEDFTSVAFVGVRNEGEREAGLR